MASSPMATNAPTFSFSDTIAGYVASFDRDADTFELRTSDGRPYRARFAANTYGELVRNLDEPYQDCTGQMRDMLQPGRHVFAYGIWYPDADGPTFEAMHLIFSGREVGEFRFEAQDWWIKQIKALANYWLHAQFPDGKIDYREYRTQISDIGTHTGDYRQETDTISRLVYGFASAYLLTGDDRYLEAAEAGTNYLRDHMRWVDEHEGVAYWYHGIDVKGTRERKILASQFGDDYDAIPAYEQIYALAGPVQTYRVTGDPRIRRDAEMTVELFDRYFLDREKGGYFSHIDPITFDPRAESLGQDRARKNWNSVGDHAPAYLINLYLATGEQRYATFLEYTFDTIAKHFPDYDNSPFVQEKFFEDWSHDEHWGWQQNRGVVGHNLKIAWNLMRMQGLKAKPEYLEFAEKIAATMPAIGGDTQRHGWYDVMERKLQPGQSVHRFAWHDRKAWWQQEQGILAYLILHGSLRKDEYLKQARESAAFYNAFFLDHDAGGVYFNVLANGLPFLMGTERFKGSHSMSGYHSFELCYLAAVYTNLLITKKPLDLYFKPKPGALEDNLLRVAPDILPPGSIKIEDVWIDGDRYADFDANALTVRLPAASAPLSVRVRVAPADQAGPFDVALETADGTARLTLSGRIDAHALPSLRDEIANALAVNPKQLVLLMGGCTALAEPAARAIVFATEKMDIDVDVVIVGASDEMKQAFSEGDFADDVRFVEHVSQLDAVKA
jgi:mannose/cellobiose epimerase-like protein (N-acyl-D-glucosamine 2-epimerase family)/anti-anti-sigma regulatory factor